MGKIVVQGNDGFCKSENTLNEYDNEISLELLNNKLERIISAIRHNDGYVCFVMGMGAQSKDTYTDLKKTTGVDLVWCSSILPKYARIFSPFIASHAGLFKVVCAESLSNVFLALIERSMAGIYVMPASFESQFVSAVKENAIHKSYDFGTKQNKDYFYYIVDADSSESSTGIYEIVSYGVNASYISSDF